jgi:superfamily II DNA or RNA helicase
VSAPSDALHAALSAHPQQTSRELVQGLARAGYPGLTLADVELLLERDPRLRHDGDTPPRWRALGAGHPATLLQLPTPHRTAPPVLAPAASFGERAPARAAQEPVTARGILPAAAFGGRPSVRLQERPASAPVPEVAAAPVPALVPTTPALPVRVSTVVRAASPVAPTASAAPVWVPEVVAPVAQAPAPAAPPAPPAVDAARPAPRLAQRTPVAPPTTPAPPPVAEPGPAPSSSAADTTTRTKPVAEPVAPGPAPVVDRATVAARAVPVAPEPRPSIEAPAPLPARAAVVPPIALEPEVAAPPVTEPAAPVIVETIAAPAVVDVPSPAVERGPLEPGGEVRYVGPQLRRWQKEVLDAWLATDRRGIVEAVTAQGRAGVGVLAAWDALTRGEKVLVLVPTTDLMEQWFGTLEIQLPGLSIGRRGDGWEHTFDECDVLVSLVSAAFGNDLLQERAGLLIADEVHKYGSARPAETLRAGFGARLGLTSSMEHLDAGVYEILVPYFGTVLDGCDLRRGRKEGVLAQFRFAFLPVDLGPSEQAEHDALSRQIAELEARLTLVHGCRPATFLDDVRALQGRWQENSTAATDASSYLRAVSTRRDLLATSPTKLDALARLAPTVARSSRSLVFTHTKDDADAAATRLRTAGVATDAFHNGLETRRASLRALRDGSLKALAAPKVIDEGVDLPPVDVVVLLAGSRSARQSVQRLSAILRPTQADRLPAAVVVYARGTVEDPELGAGEGHLEQLVDVATEVRAFEVSSSGAAIAGWFVGA